MKLHNQYCHTIDPTTVQKSLFSLVAIVFNIIFDIILGTTVRDFTQMNELCEKYGDKLVILAFPTNQFGHQENSSGQEIINALKYVRPGNGFQPKCIMFDKVSITSPNRLVPPMIRSYSWLTHHQSHFNKSRAVRNFSET